MKRKIINELNTSSFLKSMEKNEYLMVPFQPAWIVNKQVWNSVYENRYDALMRNALWPALKVILVPRSYTESIWKQPFEDHHRNTAHKIISNLVKKLQFYSHVTFSWNEVSHLSEWWKNARQKSQTALRKLVEEGRLEITTGGWVETDEATSHLFGILHQLIEGHQWLLYNLNYSPDVAWLTNTVTHSPTLPYLLSASGITNLVLTNLHFSWQQYLTEYQYTDFVWVQSWNIDKTAHTHLNEALNRIGNDRYPKHSVITHYLPFNSDGYKACGPQSDTCETEFNFVDPNNNQDINTFNVKEKSEKLLEQYSKTGSTSSHNVIISPLGGNDRYQSQAEFDIQFDNYQKIADYINSNHEIYKAKIEFGTSKDYFENILLRNNNFPTLKGDFLNYADVSDGIAAYWTGLFTTRPLLKIILRHLHSTLRSTEILFSFTLSLNSFNYIYKMSTLYDRLLNARETVARLQDRNVVSGTLTVKALRYVQQKIINTAKDCWYIQETTASLLSSKPTQNETYLEKYIYREGEFISSYKSINPGDQIYVFNPLNHERTEVVELLTRHPNIRILDHNDNEVQCQVNPVWKFGHNKIIRISSQFFKITFVIKFPPLAFVLFKIEGIYDTQNAVTIYCTSCTIDKVDDRSGFLFNIRQLEAGDIQLQNYKHRLIVDEYSGLLKTIIGNSSTERPIVIDFGAFKSSNAHSGMFLFNTNTSQPIEDILSPLSQSRAIIIISGSITTELTSLYENFLHHTVKIFNLRDDPLADVIKFETKVDYDAVPKYRDMEIFLSIQTDIENGKNPELIIDNNGFQQTTRIVNVSRRIESNIYPFTSTAYIQDQKTRLTVITDHAQGVTTLQEGQLVLLLDRGVGFDDKRGSNEGLSETHATTHTHYILLEDFIQPKNYYGNVFSRTNLKLPSRIALHLSNTLNYHLDIFFIHQNKTHLCHYAFLPLVKAPFPCDVVLINYRAVLYRGTPEKFTPNTALMTLHRQMPCCQIESDHNLQCSGDSSFKLDSIIPKVRALYQTNLVGTTEGLSVDVLNKLNFPPMELTTLRVYF